MDVPIPNLSLVVLVGPSGAGKSTFARRHFRATEVLSSDTFRGLVSDDENDQSATGDAFEALHFIAGQRLRAGRLTVIDATNVQSESRQPLVALARQHHVLPVALVFNLPEEVCEERNRGRGDRNFGAHVIRQQRSQLRRSLRNLKREGFRQVIVFESTAEVEAAMIERTRLWNDRRELSGPFDIIGDIHGCCDELEELLARLGYRRIATAGSAPENSSSHFAHPEGRMAVFLGDLVDRGPRVLDALALVREMTAQGTALCVPGNHDIKLLRKLRGKNVTVSHGLANTLAEIEAIPDEVREPLCRELAEFLDSLISHYVLDGGRLVVAHAGMKEAMQGRASGRVREFAMYGETTGETDEFGLPVRYNWALEYRGNAMVVYGHTPVPRAEWLNRTVNIDTGCVFGGALTALRYPEREFVSVPAKHTYCESARPFLEDGALAPRLSPQQEVDDLLDLDDVRGKRIVSTRLRANVTVREENGTAALEVMTRFAANPKWLVYLPPTMSPPETSTREGLLEHPDEAFAYFRSQGVAQVVCEEKHMGSRAVVVVCRDEVAARERFGVEDEAGIVYTRTGRRFFDDLAMESAVLARLRAALTAASFWEQFNTSWVVLDCELMPWSAKARELLRSQYAAVGSAATAAVPAAQAAVSAARSRLTGDDAARLAMMGDELQQRHEAANRFVTAYRQYCWPVESVVDLKLAPFHLLATEHGVHVAEQHDWHMQQLAAICHHDPEMLLATPYHAVDVTDPESTSRAADWWSELTARGGEGMVVKPREFIAHGKRGLIQPAIKCRGREYLRIIYGPDYTLPAHLTRLRQRGVATKRSLALREFALGVEGLERFVRHEPLRRVHECAFAVLALESEPVDPRL